MSEITYKLIYPRIYAMGIPINSGCIKWEDLCPKLEKLGISDRFDKLFGTQPQTMDGPFASDVEDVLERIMSGKLTGTQLLGD